MKLIVAAYFLTYKTISSMTYSPSGACAGFILTPPDDKENSYHQELWLYESEALRPLVHGAVRKAVDVLIELVILFDGAVMLYAGLQLAYSSRGNLSTALSIPMWCINSSVAVGGLLLMFQALVKIAVLLLKKEDETE